MRSLALSLSAVIYLACGKHTGLADLPIVELARFQPAIREVLQKALSKVTAQPRDPEANAAYGMALQAHNEYAAAALCYQRALALGSTDNNLPYYRGIVLAADGKYATAAESFREALRRNPNSEAVQVKLGETLLAIGDKQAAHEHYSEVARQHPGLAQAHYGLARATEADTAEAALNQALHLFPRYGAAKLALAQLYQRTRRPAAAAPLLAEYERDKLLEPPLDDPALAAVIALSLAPGTLLARAQALERAGRLQEAAALQRQVIDQDASAAQPWINLISLEARLGQPAQASEAYVEAIRRAPNSAEAHYNYGVFCFETKQTQSARKAFSDAVRADPRHADAWLNLAAIHASLGEVSASIPFYEKAIEIRPEHAQTHYQLGRVYANLNRLPQAAAELGKAAASSETATYLYALGAVQARAKHPAEARETLRRAEALAARLNEDGLRAAIATDLQKLPR